MTIRAVVTRGYGNGTFNGTISEVVRRGYDSAVVTILSGGSNSPTIWAFIMGRLIPLTTDIVTGSGTIALTQPGLFGGFDLNCDGANVGTLIVRDGSASGKILLRTSSVTGKVAYGPIPCSGTIYYSVSGTNATAFLYEWYV